MGEFRLETERLVMRSWRDSDLEPLAAICADPVVMATLGPLMTWEETRALIERDRQYEVKSGHTFWALERREDGRLIGKCGIVDGRVGPIEGLPEIGWRLASDCWGNGYITEAATAAAAWLFSNRTVDALWAITSRDNGRSRAVMDRLGMTYLPELDFDNPKIDESDPLRPHVTYKLER